jgi:hypothetical protein
MSQPPESTTSTLPLTVQAGDSQSEILVLDGRGRLLTRGFGPDCTFQLQPGIYRVKVLTGNESRETPVALNIAKTLPFGQIDFASSVPLVGTSTSHEYHMSAADQESRKVHVSDGTGSSLFFLVRNWTAPGSQSTQLITNNPALGLSLYAAGPGGERKICDLDTAGVTNPAGDPWTACTISLDPGVYELQLELPSGDTLRQPVVASPGWQTQSFLFVRQYVGPNGPEWRADFTRTSVLLTRVTGGFDPNEAILRVAELARQRLARRTLDQSGDNPDRPLLPEEMRKLLRQKFENPMLGIYAAHLMLLEPSLDTPLFRDVIGNLRMMLPQHPDVEALALPAELIPPPSVFDRPPMLARSWFLITNASVDRPDLVSEWLAQRSVGNVVTQGAWHALRAEQPSVSDVQQAMASSNASSDESFVVAGDYGRAGATASEPSAVPETAQPTIRAEKLNLTQLESAVVEALGIGRKIRRSEIQRTRTTESASPQAQTENIEEEMDSSRIRGVATRFGIPAPQVRTILNELQQKLNRDPMVPNLSVTYK